MSPRAGAPAIIGGMKTLLLVLLLLAAPASGQMQNPHTLDPEHPLLVLGGNDPLALHAGRTEAGRADFSARHAGLEYRFVSAENRAAFLRDPERYALARGGRCPVCRTVLGDPEQYRLVDGHLWLGCGEMCLDLFAERPAPFLAAFERSAKVAVLVFPGVQILDFTGPYDVFAAAGFEVFTVASSREPLFTGGGLAILPSYALSEAPAAEIVVIPGGGVEQHLEDQALMGWIRGATEKAESVLSVCNGAYFLGRLGALDGVTATTYHGAIPGLRELAPAATIVEDRRFVDSGKLVVSAGISAGIDGAMHVLEKRLGRGEAMEVALALEYDWQPERDFARAALADLRIRDALGWFFGPPDAELSVLASDGDRLHWKKSWRMRTAASVEVVRADLERVLARSWRKDAGEAWTFEHGGRTWNGSLTVAAAEEGACRIDLAVALRP